MKHELIKLPFETDALEPYMDKETVEIHYSKHHQGYVDKLNATLEGNKELEDKPVEWLLENIAEVPSELRQKVINFSGGVENHNFFWNILKKDVEFDPESEIGKAILEEFNSLEEFQEKFENAANTLFGSGWAWLALRNGKLEIVQTTNQESVLSGKMIPLINIDVWEHTYYLKYQNKRQEFVKNFWKILNWEKVNEFFISEKE
jgi:superoxide dismutase, Fe-Mn family